MMVLKLGAERRKNTPQSVRQTLRRYCAIGAARQLNYVQQMRYRLTQLHAKFWSLLKNFVQRRWLGPWGTSEQAARQKGNAAEGVAARHLRREGLKILVRNYRTATGEIDLVALDKRPRVLVFVEVKARRVDWHAGGPGVAIDWEKRRRITDTALAFLRRYRVGDVSVRFDVVTIIWSESGAVEQIVHERQAFEATHTELCCRGHPRSWQDM